MTEAMRRFGGSVSKIEFNNGTSIELKKDDIVVFVGPNNVGKSQALRDIYTLTEKKNDTVVVSDLIIKKDSGNVHSLLSKISQRTNHGTSIQYKGYNFDVWVSPNRTDIVSDRFEEFRNVFVTFLDTKNRLSTCEPPASITRNEPMTHPIHFVAFNEEIRARISAFFEKAFGSKLVAYVLNGRTIPLSITDKISIKEDAVGKDMQTIVEQYGDLLNKYPQVQEQGDGIKSFTGILLNLVIDFYRIFLIDEPESFLHPPQARIMGHTLGELLNENQQCFISTHSSDIVRGLLDTCFDRVRLIRITRNNDKNDFSVLNNADLLKLWNDPILKHSEVMSSIFYNTVVLCEGDADCKFYSMLEEYNKEQVGKYSETLFIHCGGKDRMPSVIRALKSLDISIRVIPDIDILASENTLKGMIVALGGDWNDYSKDIRILSNNLGNKRNTLNRGELLDRINEILGKSKQPSVSEDELKELRKCIEVEGKWSGLKKSGMAGAPCGDGFKALFRIVENLKKLGIFVVTVGELERFVKEEGDHGPKWVNSVVEKYPDCGNPVYNEAREFVESWNT